MLEPRNVVPYYELPVYRSTNMTDIKGIGMSEVDPYGQLPKGQTLDLQSTNIQLNCVPDKLIIFARRLPSNLTCCDTDSYLTLNNISINWNNQAGLLSSFTTEQLYRASIASGLNNLTWDEFQGLATSVAGAGLPAGSGLSEARHWYSGVGARSVIDGAGSVTDGYTGFKLVPTTGSILVLNFADVIQLTEEYYAPGSLGSFNLQLKVNATNNTMTNLKGTEYELIIIPMNTGVFVNEKRHFLDLYSTANQGRCNSGVFAGTLHQLRGAKNDRRLLLVRAQEQHGLAKQQNALRETGSLAYRPPHGKDRS